jgi:hypothetical protein
MRNTLLIVLAVVLAAIAIVICVNYGKPDVYNGTDINLRLHDYNTLVIENAAYVSIEAASSEFYAMHQGVNALIGTTTKIPLGWEHSNYFATSPTIIKAGSWTIDHGDYTVHMYSDKEMKIIVGKTTSDIIHVTFVILFVAIYVWLLIWLVKF